MSDALPVIEPQTQPALVRFHLSLNVNDLAKSVQFFELLFDRPPAKLEHDYAKFEVDEPPLVLSLEPNRTAGGGKLNHLGFRLATREALVALQSRLEMAGVSTTREEGVECCYSRQTKFWLSDPDGNLWELYTLEDDSDHPDGDRLPLLEAPVEESPTTAPAIWAHRLGEAFPERLFVESGVVDEVFLQGTFNARRGIDESARILAEVERILKPGGQLTIHQLSAQKPLASLRERLPGPAAAVEAVPTAQQLVNLLEAAGLVDIRFEKLGDAPCLTADGVECRETRLVAFKPHAAGIARSREILYKGPFRQIEDDRGQTFRRGQWVSVDAATVDRLQEAGLGEQFAERGC